MRAKEFFCANILLLTYWSATHRTGIPCVFIPRLMADILLKTPFVPFPELVQHMPALPVELTLLVAAELRCPADGKNREALVVGLKNKRPV